MRFTMTIEMENAAFEDAPGYELCRLLGQLRATVEREGARYLHGSGVALLDSNGNRVGVARIGREE